MQRQEEAGKTTIANGQFRLVSKIGEGSFGQVFLATDENSLDDAPVAVKREELTSRFPQLRNEQQALRMLPVEGFPKLVEPGIVISMNQIYLITSLLGPTLEDLFNFCGRKFSTRTSLIIFSQLLARLESMHSRALIHRDIKPDNIIMGLNETSSIVHLIDFGLTRSVLKKNGGHIEFRTGKNLVGTARFVSINAHLGYELSRRDDLLTLGYVMVYFAKGQLPWHYVDTRRRSARFEELGRLKKSWSFADLCAGCPRSYLLYFEYCNNLAFEEMPDFSFLHGLIKNDALVESVNILLRNYDWCAKLHTKPPEMIREE